MAIITHKRPAGLAQLLRSLAVQKPSPQRPFEVSILVVDNDAQRSAEPVVRETARAYPSIPFDYVVEGRQGIPFARNRALLSAGPTAQFMAFIDDDELAPETWLDEHLAALRSTGSDCAWGPVRPIFPEDANGILARSGVFDRSRPQAGLKDGQALPLAATDNVLFSLPAIRQAGLRFDESLRYSGGSDLVFFKTAARLGLTICWAKNAYVTETVAAKRMTLRYLLLRQYRTGNTFVKSNIFDFGSPAFPKYLATSLGFLTIGILTLAYPFRAHTRMEGLVRIMNGMGILGALLGLTVDEYAARRLT